MIYIQYLFYLKWKEENRFIEFYAFFRSESFAAIRNIHHGIFFYVSSKNEVEKLFLTRVFFRYLIIFHSVRSGLVGVPVTCCLSVPTTANGKFRSETYLTMRQYLHHIILSKSISKLVSLKVSFQF